MLKNQVKAAGRFEPGNLPEVVDLSFQAARVANRARRIEAQARLHHWGALERAFVDRLIEAVENGEFAGAYIHAARWIEKVDGTAKSREPVSGCLDRQRDLARWYIALKAAWMAQGVSVLGVVLVLVSGFDVKAAEAAIGRKPGGQAFLSGMINEAVMIGVGKMRACQPVPEMA